MSGRPIVYKGSWPGEWSDLLSRFCAQHDLQIETAAEVEEVHAFVNRSFPSCLVLEGATDREEALALCSDLKKDPFTAVVPIVVLVLADQTDLISDWLAAGADEVVSETHSEREQDLRLELVIRRAQRDVAVHPTTRLPGTVLIERNIADRLRYGEEFAVCYADLDNFKEFNDRYGYNHGDHVILLLSRILRDVVRGLAPEGFVGHIGGDDFIFIVNLKYLEACCDEIIYLFDELIPYQYTVEDRRAGYLLGKDRRGSIRRVPLMTLSIGVVTNQIQPFTHTAQVSELAAEMKTYTKSLPGSVYAVDRRRPFKEEVEQPMTITVSCPSCETSFPVDQAKIPPEGVRAQCSVCTEIFDVDRPSAVATETPPAPESMIDTVEIADPLDTGVVDLPAIDGAFEGVDATVVEAEPGAGEIAQAEAEDVAAEVVEAESPGPIRFGRRSPADKAKSLGRSLVSDLIAYNPEKHKEALAGGTLPEVFREEIEKSLKEYQEQVEPDVMAEGSFFNDALNSILAEGKTIFSLDE